MPAILPFLKRNLLPVAAAFGLAALAAQTEIAVRIEAMSLDWRTRLRAQLNPTVAPAALAVIGIDERSLREIGRWPWPHARHGDFIQLAAQTTPAVIAWDILFTEKAADTKDLVDSIREANVPIVFGALRARSEIGLEPNAPAVQSSRLKALPNVHGDRTRILAAPALLLPVGELAHSADIAFVDTPPGVDGIRRILPLVVRIDDAVYPTLALQTLLAYWHARPEQVDVRLGQAIWVETPGKRHRIPIDASGGLWLNYRHTLEGYANYGYSRLFAGLRQKYAEEKPVSVPALENCILLVGEVADGLSDLGPTPFGPLSPLVLVHANGIENVLNEDFCTRAPRLLVWLAATLVGIVGAEIFTRRRLGLGIAFSVSAPLLYIAAASAAWTVRSLELPLVMPLLGFALSQAYTIARRVRHEQRAKEQIRGTFGTYVSPAVVNQIIESGQQPKLGGHQRELTAYFSDIQGFSTFSELLPPEQLVELLNDYLTMCTDILQEQGGTLDKYIGDAVVGMFGAPLVFPDHAYRACITALRVQQGQIALRERWSREGERWPAEVRHIRTRIGLNTGAATIGNMGSRTRFNYTMTGDNVNLAARMESGAKAWGVYTLCTDATRAACEQHVSDTIVFRPLGQIVVVGRAQPVGICEVVATQDSLSSGDRECLGLFAEGLAAYLRRDWNMARAKFAASAALERFQPGRDPGVRSNPSTVYTKLVEQYAANVPKPDWTGVHVMTEK